MSENVHKNYSLRQACNLLGIKVRTARLWIREGRLHAIKYNTHWYVSEDEIVRLQNGNKG